MTLLYNLSFSNHENIVSIIDIFENTFDNVKCLLVVVEFLEGGDLLTQFESQGSQPYSEESEFSHSYPLSMCGSYMKNRF